MIVGSGGSVGFNEIEDVFEYVIGAEPCYQQLVHFDICRHCGCIFYFSFGFYEISSRLIVEYF